jgi:hypothetical protein
MYVSLRVRLEASPREFLLKGRLSTLDLLIKIACFVKKKKISSV